MLTKIDAKNALDKIISKSRVHFYKPIQIAEILYKIRTEKNINPMNLEEYEMKAKNGAMKLQFNCSAENVQAVRDFKMICLMKMQFRRKF